MRVLVCGDRNWIDFRRIFWRLSDLPADEHIVIIEGGAKGADSLAALAAEELRIDYTEFPANWARYGRAAGPIRNQQMLDEGKPDLVLAFHSDLSKSKGTADMVRRARKAGVPVEVITGEIK